MQIQDVVPGCGDRVSPGSNVAPPGPETTNFRLVTWNLNHWRQPLLPTDTRRAAWEYLSRGIGAQVALVQEAVPPLELERDRAVYGEIAGHRNWGSAVVALDPAVSIEPLRSVRIPWTRRRFLLANTHPGSVAIARLVVPGIQPITLVSVYGVLDGSPVSTMLRVDRGPRPALRLARTARGSSSAATSTSRARRRTRGSSPARRPSSPRSARSGSSRRSRSSREPPASPADCPCGNGGTCSHLGTWGGRRARPPLRVALARGPGDGPRPWTRPRSRPGCPTTFRSCSTSRSPRSARPTPGTRSRSRRRSGAGTVPLPATSSRSSSTGPSGRSASSRRRRACAPRCSPASRPTAARRNPS